MEVQATFTNRNDEVVYMGEARNVRAYVERSGLFNGKVRFSNHMCTFTAIVTYWDVKGDYTVNLFDHNKDGFASECHSYTSLEHALRAAHGWCLVD